MTDELRNNLTPKQIEILEFDIKYKPRLTILEGAIRSAKTTTNIFMFLNHIANFKKKKFIITGSSIASIKRNVLDDITRLFGIDTGLSLKNEFSILDNTIICFGADKSDSYKAMKGFTAYGWLGNEVTEHHSKSIDQAFKRCSGKGARIFWDTNPDDPDHPIKTDYIDKEPYYLSDGRLDIKTYHFVLDDNTKLNPEYIESIKRNTPPGMLYDRDILGLWVGQDEAIGAFETVPEWKCQYCLSFIDPSFSDRTGTDSTAVAIVGVHNNLMIFTGMLWQKSIANPDTRKELLDFLDIYKPIQTVFESQLVDSSIFFLDTLKSDEIKYGYEIKNLWTVKHQHRAKHERIMSTVGVQKNNLRLLEGTQQNFSLEVSRYRKDIDSDDAPDALAGAIEALATSEIIGEYVKALNIIRRR